MSQLIGGKKMIKYNGYIISKMARRGVYQIADINGNIIVVFPHLYDCKKFIDKKVGA
jgi:hypothetical protein